MLTLDALDITVGDFHLSADCQISHGITAIMGPSGGGKSTLLSAIAGFIQPNSGAISYDGKPFTDADPGHRPVSILFQDNNLFPHMTIAQNVGLGLRLHRKLRPTEDQSVTDALRAVGLDGMAHRKPAALSGGQQSRAALARVLLADQPIVLLDEPFSALGPGLKTEMLTLVRDTLVAVGKTIIMVTHDPQDARTVADHVILISDHTAHPPVPTEALFTNPPAALRSYLGDS